MLRFALLVTLPIMILGFHMKLKRITNNSINLSAKKYIKNFTLNMLSVSDVLKNPKWPAVWPFQPKDFSRQDESNDNQFYNQPRYVYHIDDYAVIALTNYYKSIFKNDASILDICSSWVSHYPKDIKFNKVSAIGIKLYYYKSLCYLFL